MPCHTHKCPKLPENTGTWETSWHQTMPESSKVLKMSFNNPSESHFYTTCIKDMHASPSASLWWDHSSIALASRDIYNILMASSIATLHSLGQDDWKDLQHYIFGHVTPLALASASHNKDSLVNGTIAFLVQDDQNEVQHKLFGHVMSLALASHDTDGIINGTFAFIGLTIKMRFSMSFLVMWCHWCWHQHHMMPMALLHSLGQDDQNDM